MSLDIVFVLIGLAGLYFGGEFLVTGSSRVALAFKVSPLIIGLTIVAIGTSAPELFVSIIAAFQGRPGIALGNVIGSNIANIGLILGFTGALRALTVQQVLVKREIPILVIVTMYATIMIFDGTVSRIDGIMLLFGFIVFNYLFLELARHPQKSEDGDESDVEAVGVEGVDEADPAAIKIPLEIVRIVGGVALLVIGANLMVTGASNIALAFGVSELVVGVTIVAFGTSLPELATSITAAFKGETDIAVGNVIGSNVANLLLVLGMTSTINPIDVAPVELSLIEYIVMLGYTLLLIPFSRNRELSRMESALFLGIYIAFIFYSFVLSS